MTTQSTFVQRDLLARAGDSEKFERWSRQVAATGYCSHPIRLSGRRQVVDIITGEITRDYTTDDEPDGVLLVACGNRRASRCRTCSATYRADTWQLVAAGLRGGKGIPETVGDHPRFFLTLTAPSFGAVHSRRGKSESKKVCRIRRGTCAHGNPLGCSLRHTADDPLLGSPQCTDCFDYAGMVLWNSHAGELWRRTTIYLRRQLAYGLGISPAALKKLVRVSYTKVAEYQQRGAIHFHAVVRLDGVPTDGATDDLVLPGLELDPATFARAVDEAIAAVQVSLPAVGDGRSRVARWGEQHDLRVIDAASETANPIAIAAYIAKYSTKSTEVVTPGLDRRLRIDDIDQLDVGQHVRRIVSTCWDLGGREELADLRLRKWAHMLGFRGHFGTRSRRYSVTLGSLREARAVWQQARRAKASGSDVWSPVETGLAEVLAHWRYTGTGFTRLVDFWFADSNRHSALIALDESRAYRRTLRLAAA